MEWWHVHITRSIFNKYYLIIHINKIGLPGSRSGGLIATAWASLMHLGEEELIKITGVILNAIYMFKNAISEKITDLEVIGDPLASVVAFKSRNKRVNIYQVNDLMSQKGWHLNVLQFPPALHLAFTARHINVVNSLIKVKLFTIIY